MFQLSTLLHTHPKFGDVFCDVFLVFLDFGLCRIGLMGTGLNSVARVQRDFQEAMSTFQFNQTKHTITLFKQWCL